VVTVSYHCPRCGAVAELERDAYLADRCVTAEPLDGWEYADAWEDSESRRASGDASGERSDPRAFDDADGVVIVCGAAETDGEGCGEPYYLSFVKFEDGEAVDPGLPYDDPRFDFLR
jgi:hypothetical protein